MSKYSLGGGVFATCTLVLKEGRHYLLPILAQAISLRESQAPYRLCPTVHCEFQVLTILLQATLTHGHTLTRLCLHQRSQPSTFPPESGMVPGLGGFLEPSTRHPFVVASVCPWPPLPLSPSPSRSQPNVPTSRALSLQFSN